MEPIISPALIYLIGISSNVQLLCNLLASVAVALAILTIAIYFDVKMDTYYDDDDKQDTVQLCRKIIKYSIVCVLTLGAISALIPSKAVATAMVVANYITPDNLHGTNDAIKSNLQDYVNIIVEGINKVK